MTAVYTDPAPTPKTPLTIQVAGNKFDVLQSAWDTIGDIKPGDSVSLLLTADGKVAGIVKPTPQARSTAIGVIEGGSVSIYLPNGSTMSLGKVSNASGIQNGQPVIVSAARDSFTVTDKMPFMDLKEEAQLEEIFSLPPADRAAIHLFYYEGCSTEEIANLTGQRPGAVRTRLSRARGKLRKLLEESQKGEL